MTPAQLESAERTAFEQFVAAVLALSDDPEPANVERYLEASRALERSREAFVPLDVRWLLALHVAHDRV